MHAKSLGMLYYLKFHEVEKVLANSGRKIAESFLGRYLRHTELLDSYLAYLIDKPAGLDLDILGFNSEDILQLNAPAFAFTHESHLEKI